MIFLVCGGHLGYDPVLTHFRESDFGRLFFSQSLHQLEQETVVKPFVRICLGSDGILTRLLCPCLAAMQAMAVLSVTRAYRHIF